MSARALTAGLALLALACGDGGRPAPSRPAEASAAPALAPVVERAIAALEAELAATDALPPPPDEAAVAAAREPVAGLVEALAASSERDSLRRMLLEELAAHGDASLPHLAALLADRTADPAWRAVAAEALGALDTPAAAAVLLEQVESSRLVVEPEAWLIAQCAWRLSRSAQDWIAPRLLLCLRYEEDHETVLWLVAALAHFGNYSGLEALRVIAAGDSPTRERAAGLYAQIASAAGFEHGAALERAWAGRSEREPPEVAPSLRSRLETWRLIRSLSDWQLRGVDDGRFVLSRSGTAVAEQLAQALSDQDVYIRVHSAQCLERMGPRGRAAAPALVAALDDPRLAPAAAAALGGLEAASAGPALAARLAPAQPLELRAAAARALGRLPGHGAAAGLAELARDEREALELRAAAAGALVRTAPPAQAEPAVRLLGGLLDSQELEVPEVEAALRDWLARLEGAPELLEDWDAAAGSETAARLAARAAVLEAALAVAGGE